jgi:hypothetical protein
MSDKKPESPHPLRSALDRVLVHDIKNMGFRLQMLLSNIDEHYDDPRFKASVQELLRTTVERLDGMVERFSGKRRRRPADAGPRARGDPRDLGRPVLPA